MVELSHSIKISCYEHFPTTFRRFTDNFGASSVGFEVVSYDSVDCLLSWQQLDRVVYLHAIVFNFANNDI